MQQRLLLVTTVSYSAGAVRLAGAFAALGSRVAAVFPRDHALGVSRYVEAAYRYRALSPRASIEAAIRATSPDRVVACDDRALTQLLALTEFAALLERSFGDIASYGTLTARTPSIAAARAAGIAAPLTLGVGNLAALPAALEQVGLPCVMKTDSSWGGQGVRFVTTRQDAEQAFVRMQGPPSRLRSLVRAARRRDLHFLAAAHHPAAAVVNVQALVQGRPATTVFSAVGGKVTAMQHMDVVSWNGTTGPASLMQRVADPAMAAAAATIAARFRLSGLHGLDFVRDAAGLAHLIEINPRATQICHLPLDGDVAAGFLGVPARPPVTGLKQVALFPHILGSGDLPASVYRDIPWDDPGVVRLACDEGGFKPDDLAVVAGPEGLGVRHPALGGRF